MIKTEKGVFEASGPLNEVGADLGIAILGYRDMMIEQGVDFEAATSIVTKVFYMAIACDAKEKNNGW